MLHHLKYALSLSPRAAVTKGGRWLLRLARGRMRQITLSGRDPYPTDTPTGPLCPLLSAKSNLPAPSSALNDQTRAHRFDLLGSGFKDLSADAPAPTLSPGARATAAAIRALVDHGYVPIDWHVDFKSGYRWAADRVSDSLAYGHVPGVDVKVPWELARLQHLPPLALEGGGEAEIRNQVLDFIAANPPGFGVNWMCAMDVAIRGANMAMACAIVRAKGHVFDADFETALASALLAHGRFVKSNLEVHGNHLGNHYLADVAGLAFIACALPATDETQHWRSFARREIETQTAAQFLDDGANFEASTSYHRLSAEMVTYATAVLSGAKGIEPFSADHFARLERMAEFCLHITKPNGRVAQVGDNDSGRFFKLVPVLENGREVHLDHRATVAAINGFFGRNDFADFAGSDMAAETAIVSALAGGIEVPSREPVHRPLPAEDSALPTGRTVDIQLPKGVGDGVETVAYPDFGLFIWRGPRLFLSVRCGPVGQNGNGGHAHNDQLAIELTVDGEDWLADPGSYLYTADTTQRNAYRSVAAHAAPRLESTEQVRGQGREQGREPSRLDLGLFSLEDNASARCLRFDANEFLGVHVGYGEPVTRRVQLDGDTIHVTDSIGAAETVRVTDGPSTRAALGGNQTFSPGYGIKAD